MTQTETILAHLQSGGSITPIDALREYGCFRLAARIKEIRDEGHPVEMTWETDGEKRWARYSLLKDRAVSRQMLGNSAEASEGDQA